MHKLFGIILFLCTFGATLFGQSPKLNFNHSLSVGKPNDVLKTKATTRILAVMVEFQPDTDNRTTGTGVFGGLDYLAARGDTILDPLPHDMGYFTRKLEFLKNYFAQTSNGKTQLTFTLLPNIYRLSKPIAQYSPPRRSSNFINLATMVEETWRTVDSVSSIVDFSQFDCFIIFHAGVGRDIDLVSLTGTDPAPSDLPSITFNLNGFKNVFGQTFEGISVDGGSNKITNTLIIPATESREIDGVGGKVLLELSTNGLLCASFGSYLGLPDLFNTETGRSGIGRFGLMDGEGFFNFNGALPPEPSAWERVELGWATPITLNGIDAYFKLAAQGLHQNADSAIVKIPITSREYFLVENRQRNPKGSGVSLSVFRNGQTITQTFLQDQDDFRFENLNALNGQVVASNNYDWTLPTAEVRGARYDGGILVWHIDEATIEANRSQNRVNTDRIKGVKLLEADGSDDIGQNYGITDAGLGSQSGTVFDMFFNGNSAFPYRNFIDDGTNPNTRANRGAASKIKLSNFPRAAAVMDSIRLQRGDNLVRVLNGFPIFFDKEFNIRSGITLYQEAQPLYVGAVNSGAISASSFSTNLGAALSVNISGLGERKLGFTNNLNRPFLGVKDSAIIIPSNLRQVGGSFVIDSIRVGSQISTQPLVDTLNRNVSVGTQDGFVRTFSLDNLTKQRERKVSSKPIVSISTTLYIAEDRAISPDSFAVWNFNGKTAISGVATGFQNPLPRPVSEALFGAVLTTNNELLLIKSNNIIQSVKLPVVNQVKSQPVIADLENREPSIILGEELAIVFTADDKIFAYNLQGFPISNFPILTNSKLPIASSPVVADVDGDAFADVIVQTPDGRLMAFNRFGKNLFTLPIAEGTETTPTVAPSLSGQGLALFSVDKFGLLSGYELPNATRNIEWGALYGDNLNSNSYSPIRSNNRPTTSVNEFLPEKSVFNYPNPASTETAFRFFLKESGTVTVKVFDMTGARVWESSKQSAGGFDDEILWNVRSAQSGVYFAVLTAKSNRGEEKSVKLKVAVVK